jgi:hypothetical protein
MELINMLDAQGLRDLTSLRKDLSEQGDLLRASALLLQQPLGDFH